MINNQLIVIPAKAADLHILSDHDIRRNAYEKALERCGDNSTLKAMAKFGLGLCAEELGEYEKAAEIYEQIATEPDFEGTVFPVRATARLEGMHDSRVEFVFVEVPEPEIELAPVGNDETENATSGAEAVDDNTDSAEPVLDEGSVEPASPESETK